MINKTLAVIMSSAAIGITSTSYASAEASDFPERPVRLISPTVPGGMADAIPRLYADKMSEALGQPVIVENRPGAATMVATRYVADRPADGHTLLVAANTIVTMPHINENAGYEPEDFVGVGEMSRAPTLLVTSASSPIESLSDLVQQSKDNPGSITYASGGTGTTSHISVELFSEDAGIDLLHIPYSSRSLAIPDILSGRVDLTMMTSIEEQSLRDELRVLASTSDVRTEGYPDVPTFKELGYSGGTYLIFLGIFAPSETPGEVVEALAAAVEYAKNDEGLRGRLDGMGQEYSTTARSTLDFNDYLSKESERYRVLVESVGIEYEE
ncbi:Bug family tripartite tricarboxylate transporter substrate binding protein [Halomonas sp. HK25]|uniref:Bug family tripartite tricarboxylate transporter substrate binding protein n=1 Tax=Halomonas sp. HK25 TaxID=3394321 RepID=UPI0039FBD242